MFSKTKIALRVPQTEKNSRYFSFRLKEGITNEAAEYNTPKRIFVLSDIEGNFKSFCRILRKAKVVDDRFQWIFDDNHLVIIGDCFDRGEQVTECLWLIYSLEERAQKYGGYVHFILGNHEIMNMNGDWRYVHPKYAEITRQNKPHTALYHGNNELWRWLCTKNILEKIGDILFVHAGISEELLLLKPSVYDINVQTRAYYTNANKLFSDPLLSIIYNSENSPFWYRGYYLGTASEELIDATLKHFGVKTIVTGHTVIDQVSSYFNGKIINVDTDHASGNSEGLMINKDRFYRIKNDGKRERIK